MTVSAEATTCSKCNRVLFKKDVKASGMCVTCDEPETESAPEPKPNHCAKCGRAAKLWDDGCCVDCTSDESVPDAPPPPTKDPRSWGA